MEAVKDQIRDVGWERSIETFWQDIRYAARLLRTSPGFTLVVTVTLSLAIGASLTIFSVMHAVLWRPLPYPQADRLVTITRSFGPATGGLSPGEALELRSSSDAFTRVAQANGVDAFVAVGDEMTHVSAASATDDMLELVGAVPLALGRPLRAATDIRAGRVVAAVISNRLWRQIFHGDPSAVGRHIQVNNHGRRGRGRHASRLAHLAARGDHAEQRERLGSGGRLVSERPGRQPRHRRRAGRHRPSRAGRDAGAGAGRT